MIKLIINNVDGYILNLVDDNGKDYLLNIEFYDINVKPSINDYIFINEELVKENNILSFGSIDSIYGRKIENTDDKDLLVLLIDNKKYYLKRLYG